MSMVTYSLPISLNYLSTKMSASKLIIRKIEAGEAGSKFMYVKFEDTGNSSPQVKYSEWAENKIQDQRKNDSEKSSRLVVKIVSGNELDKFDLDLSAKEIDNADKYVMIAAKSATQKKQLNELFYKINNNCNEKYHVDESRDGALNNPFVPLESSMNYEERQLTENSSNRKENYISPLEHSLEKVKENNARIMENIHMLNRTLNYTKKKEILDIVCPKSMRSYPCNTCGKCFVYETGLRRHFSMRHAMTEIQPRWQVVWTCIQCFQVWPQQDQALKHSSDCCKSNNKDCVREIKTSSLLQCEFCEKVYTSIPRLLRHCKIHTTTNNYECNACGIAFLSYKIAEQHWVVCPWLKMYYSFSLPKLLLCHTCDRKFRNYEQLYNHRYKVGHFMTKAHCSQENAKSVGILVYQCEVCGQWYPSITPLKAHKIQHHPKDDTIMQYRMDSNYKERKDYDSPAENEHYLNQTENYNHY